MSLFDAFAEGQTASVFTAERSGVGFIVLNRPRALHALTADMVLGIQTALESWRGDPRVNCVVIGATEDRAFCAGGDIRRMHEAIVSGETAGFLSFLRKQYEVDAAIAEYPVPVLTVINGIAMGGGVGIGCHASHRIVTERGKIAMPEARIGFAPDAGGTYLLSRAPGRLGEALAMSGRPMDASDALFVGFADYSVPSESIDDMLTALISGGGQDPEAIIAEFLAPAADSVLSDTAEEISFCMQAETTAGVVGRLEASAFPALGDLAFQIGRNSPLAVAAARMATQRARSRSLRECLRSELKTARILLETADLREGIRSQVIDKDRSPRWQQFDSVGDTWRQLLEAA